MEKEIKKFEKKKKFTEGIFMAVILILFAAFLLLWLKADSVLPRYIVGVLLIVTALAYKKVEKTLKKEEESLKKDDSEE